MTLCIAGFAKHNNCDITWTLLCMEPKTFCQTSGDLINGIQLGSDTYFPLQLLHVTPRFYGPSRCLQQPPSATSSPSPWSKAKGKSHPTWNTLITTSLHIWRVKNHRNTQTNISTQQIAMPVMSCPLDSLSIVLFWKICHALTFHFRKFPMSKV